MNHKKVSKKKQRKVTMSVTKEQKRAIEMLIYDLDELDNKPRRLYSSLSEFAKAFCKDGETMDMVLKSINDAQERHYEDKGFHYDVTDAIRKIERGANDIIFDHYKDKSDASDVCAYEVKEMRDLAIRAIYEELIIRQ